MNEKVPPPPGKVDDPHDPWDKEAFEKYSEKSEKLKAKESQPEETTEAQWEAGLNDLNAHIKDRYFATAPNQPKSEATPTLEQLKTERDNLTRQIEQMEQRVRAERAGAAALTSALAPELKRAEGKVENTPPTPAELIGAGDKLKADREGAKPAAEQEVTGVEHIDPAEWRKELEKAAPKPQVSAETIKLFEADLLEIAKKINADNEEKAKKGGFLGVLTKIREKMSNARWRSTYIIMDMIEAVRKRPKTTIGLGVGAAILGYIAYKMFGTQTPLSQPDTFAERFGALPSEFPVQGFGDDPLNVAESAKLYPAQDFGKEAFNIEEAAKRSPAQDFGKDALNIEEAAKMSPAQDFGKEAFNIEEAAKRSPAQGFGHDPLNVSEAAKLYPVQDFGQELPKDMPSAANEADMAHVPEEAPAPTPEASPSVVDALNTTAEVTKKSETWTITEKLLVNESGFKALERAQKDYVLDNYMKLIQKIGPQKMGISSGDVNVIHVGERIDFSQIAGKDTLKEFIEGALRLSKEQKAEILKLRLMAGS